MGRFVRRFRHQYVLALCVTAFLTVLNAGAETTGARTLIVAADVDYAPFSFLQDGRPTGFDVAFFDLVAAELGVEVEYRLGVWSDIHRRARLGEFDVVLGVLYTEERREYLTFTEPYNVFRFALAVHQDSPIRGLADVRGRRMAFLSGDAVPQLLLENQNIVVEGTGFPTLSQALQSVSRGEADFVIAPREFLDAFDCPECAGTLRVIADQLLVATYRMGIGTGRTDLVPAVNAAIEHVVSTDAYSDLERRWLPMGRGVADHSSVAPVSGLIIVNIVLLVLIVVGLALFAWFRRAAHIRLR